MKYVLLLLVSVTSVFSVAFATPSDDVVGIWLNSSGKGKIQVYKENGK